MPPCDSEVRANYCISHAEAERAGHWRQPVGARFRSTSSHWWHLSACQFQLPARLTSTFGRSLLVETVEAEQPVTRARTIRNNRPGYPRSESFGHRSSLVSVVLPHSIRHQGRPDSDCWQQEVRAAFAVYPEGLRSMRVLVRAVANRTLDRSVSSSCVFSKNTGPSHVTRQTSPASAGRCQCSPSEP